MNEFERILTALRSADVAFVIVGGVAATVHGSARLTSDIDIVYQRSRRNIERLVDALTPLHPYLRGAPPGLPFHFDVETVRRGLNFRLATEAGPIDALVEITGIGDYEAVLAVSEEVSLYGANYRCISLDALITRSGPPGGRKTSRPWQSWSSFATKGRRDERSSGAEHSLEARDPGSDGGARRRPLTAASRTFIGGSTAAFRNTSSTPGEQESGRSEAAAVRSFSGTPSAMMLRRLCRT